MECFRLATGLTDLQDFKSARLAGDRRLKPGVLNTMRNSSLLAQT